MTKKLRNHGGVAGIFLNFLNIKNGTVEYPPTTKGVSTAVGGTRRSNISHHPNSIQKGPEDSQI